MRTALEKAYSRYNRKYFGNGLPKVSEVELRWEKIPEMGYQVGYEIVINRKDRRRESVWKLTLLHEMVHMYLPDACEHGKKFQKEMLRLARLGAFKGLW